MRICLITSSFLPMVGGAEIVVHNLATALTRLGHQVIVVAPGYSRPFRTHLPYALHSVLPGTLLLMARSGRLGEAYFLATLALVRRARPDVVNLHFVLPLGPALVRHKHLLSAPVVLTFHGTDIQKEASLGYGLRLDPRLESRIRFSVNGADGLVAISRSIRESALELLEAPPRRVFDIPNGVDVERFRRVGLSGLFRSSQGIPQDARMILAVGRNHPKKGFRYLVDAMRIVVDTEPGTWCVILGRGVNFLSDHVRQLGLSGHVILAEEIGVRLNGTKPLDFPSEAVINAYRDSDIFVSPSLIEGCSLSVIEALAAGLPVVVTDAPGNRDAVKDGTNGLLCSPRDPEDLARKLLAVLRDSELRSRLSRAARTTAQAFDWTPVAMRYARAYETVVHSARHEGGDAGTTSMA